jgi:hypothetical protein
LRKRGIDEFDMLFTDLQGMDLTVLKTLEDYIINKKIRIVHCEVEFDSTPAIHINLPSNKKKDFQDFLEKNYKEFWQQPGSENSWETDIVWVKI